jgi:hypothetical protein
VVLGALLVHTAASLTGVQVSLQLRCACSMDSIAVAKAQGKLALHDDDASSVASSNNGF